ERIETWGLWVLIGIIVIGVFLAFKYSIVKEYVLVNSPYYNYKYEWRTTFKFLTFLTTIFITAVTAFFQYCIYHIIALFIASLGSIVQHTKISADVALFNARAEDSEEKVSYGYKTDPNTFAGTPNAFNGQVTHSWRCPHCGNMISSSVCPHCGETSAPKQKAPAYEVTVSQKICQNCGCKNLASIRTCTNCGQPLN
ncbi:MAG: hypothetical protein J5766_01000, partial [Clostridia bacterium]|nr:hypothetical protein [Clostridia bacterium]